jgi:N-acylneuraminate cytidylyltransferase
MRLAVIPARGGSKGLPGKNIRGLAGRPLLAWSIAAAESSDLVDRTLVSTDSPEIADVARSYGAEVIERPAEFATDEATTIAVLGHVARSVPEAGTFVVLQPTSPLRDLGLIDDCVRQFESGDLNPSAVSTQVLDG